MLLLAKWYLPLCQGRKKSLCNFLSERKLKNNKSEIKNAIKPRPFINSLYFSERSPPVELSAVLTRTAAAHTYRIQDTVSSLEEETLKHFIT